MKKEFVLSELALNGGPKVRAKAFPGRGLLGPEEKAAVDALFDEAIATGNAFGYGGPAEEAYCREFAGFLGGGWADAVNSGTSAVFVALHALNPEPFTEIIVSPVTDPGGIMPIVMLNCVPMIADTEPGSYNVGPEQVAELISERTSAILIAHIGGEPVNIEPIAEIARKHKVPLVEDCAQAHGARINGRLLGTFGDIAAFSTMFGKHHCTGGQGGVVFTRNERLYREARQASDRGKPFGLPAGSTNCRASLNLNLNDFSAAIGRVQLKKLPGIVARRQEFVSLLREGFRGLKAVSIPSGIPGAEPSYWFLRLSFHPEAVSCSRDTFLKSLAAEGIPAGSYPGTLPQDMDWYRNRRVFGRSGLPWTSPLYKGDPARQFLCPNARKAAGSLIRLETYESWGRPEAEDIIAAFRKVESAYSY